MRSRRALLAICAAAALHTIGHAQDWTDEQLVAASDGFAQDALVARYTQAALLAAAGAPAQRAIAARLHGDHREYQLKIERLLDGLADARWQVREDAERQLTEVGGRARPEIQAARERAKVLEQQIRCGRILEALAAKGTESEDRERQMVRGLVLTALHLDGDDRLRRALRSALGHTSPQIVAGALRALGKHGDDDDVAAVAEFVGKPDRVHRGTALAALARMRAPAALAQCERLLFAAAGEGVDRAEAMLVVRGLRSRDDAAAAGLLAKLAQHPDAIVRAGASVALPAATATPTPAKLTLLPERATVDAAVAGLLGDALVVDGAFAQLPTAELALADCDRFEFPAHAPVASTMAHVFLNQGTLLRGELTAIRGNELTLRTARFGTITVARRDVQGIAFDESVDRLLGGSKDRERLRLRDGRLVDGEIAAFDGAAFRTVGADGAAQTLPFGEVASAMFARPGASEPDPLAYARLDLTDGERLLGFLAACNGGHVAIAVPGVGAIALPWTDVQRAELATGGGASWGFTLVADYSDNRVFEVDEQGRVVFDMQDVLGAWDAEALDNGNLLLTEYLVSRVQEVDRKGNQVWAFEDLKNPYDADRLADGNTLIADTFGGRIIEVDRAGKIVWSYAKEIRPFDVDRLPDGNTLIADVLKDRVIEVTRAGDIVWERKQCAGVHDADRLPNGNTLITSRSLGTVVEVDRAGTIVFTLSGLNSPSDADRLPNGNTLVAENGGVREFDRRGNVVWKLPAAWAVEVGRY
jgi:HEAT repeat protein